MPLDFFVFSKINGLALKWLGFDVLGIFLAKYLPYVLAAVLLLFLLKDFKKYFRPIIEAFIAAGLGSIVVVIIRFFCYQPRPFQLEQVSPLFNHSAGSGFPSLHTTFFFGLSAVILLYNKKLGSVFFVASFLMALSRIFCGLHWPSDILAGVALGILSALLIYKMSHKEFLALLKK